MYGPGTPHYLSFLAAYERCEGDEYAVEELHGLFDSARDDFEGSYVFTVELRVSGEVFGDFVALARHWFSEGHKDVAAVFACAVLEDALKRYALVYRLAVGDKGMQEVVSALRAGA